MKRLLVAAMLIASGVAAAEAREAIAPAANGYQCSHFVPPENLAPSDASYGKHLATQYNTANGE